MYNVIVNNGQTLLDDNYESLVFHFKNLEETAKFMEIIFQYGEDYGIEIYKINQNNESDI